ncbi:hypothetical protein [Levilactobacillus namurensis]|uniref:hypothetical protein n=1 Tax=Levilactobacillus namurensis TaxID=380393 RepID=UPI001D9F24B5|nr:hypothetical protein [Levilactobacillus namurensis]HJE45416.1 DUF1129 domain-containing protein [Levilactobacillus namurensis]
MTKTQATLDEINRLTEQLAPADQAYFTDLQLYLSTAGLFYDEAQLNDQLLNMLLDLREANQHGQSAQAFFGNDPQTMGNHLIQQFPQPKLRDQLGLFSLLVGISWLFQILSSPQTAGGLSLNLVAFILVPILEICAIILIIRILHTSIYPNNHHQWWPYLLTGLIVTITISLIVILNSWVTVDWTFLIPDPWHTILLATMAIGATGYLLGALLHRWRHHQA